MKNLELCVAILIRNPLNNEVVFCHNKQRGWELPGGKPLEGEPPLKAAERELMEETKLVAPTLTLIGAVEDTPGWLCLVYYGETCYRPEIGEPEKFDAVLPLDHAAVRFLPTVNLAAVAILDRFFGELQRFSALTKLSEQAQELKLGY